MIENQPSRLATVDSQTPQIESVAHLRIAGIELAIEFDRRWSASCIEFCRRHWSPFLVPPTQPRLKITLSPAREPYLDVEHSMWNAPEPFQSTLEKDGRTWLLHRDFTGAAIEDGLHAWLPEPKPGHTDGLDNIVTLALQRSAQELSTFLLHAAVVEHQGQAVIFFGPSGIGKSTLAKLSHDLGFRVMASDQVYLGVEDDRLWVSACPTSNPDLPRSSESWVTEKLWVKSLFNLQRKGQFEIANLEAPEMSRRLFTELFCDLSSGTEDHFRSALKFAARVAADDCLFQGSLSYPRDFNFWPTLEKMGYI